ncbi:MAG: phosphoserine aminotransferase apoenzyme [Bacteroidetes bacterium]|nr:phosphoserine aminotransferase apoenzyme [Bacteroidota bacterium]
MCFHFYKGIKLLNKYKFFCMKKHNFNAGPSILPREVIEKTAQAVLDFNGSGLSVLEISHRAKDFQPVVDEAEALFKELLGIPEGYSVLFLGGGASLQFCMVPFNLLEKKAAYLNTGTWASKALKEAKGFGEVVEVASSKAANFNYIPKDYVIPADADYFHITTNNTIFGTELFVDFDSPVPVVADMSSDIFSRQIDVSKYALIYGGAQKNLAPAGLAFAIVKNDILGKVSRYIPTMLSYQTHIDNGSMFNTPPVLPIYSALETLRWLKANGGIAAMEQKNIAKANLLYNEIDRNKLFVGTAAVEDRSRMNICFVMKPEYAELEAEFQKFATERGMIGIKGHRSVGGFRASTYNALPIESVQALVDCMKEFEKLH